MAEMLLLTKAIKNILVNLNKLK